MSNRIEQIIENIYEFVDNCKPHILSQNKVIVPRDELFELLDELRVKTPDEIKRYQKIISNRDAIIKDAEEKAADIIEAAQRKAETILNENSIIQQAYAQANEVFSEASERAKLLEKTANRNAAQIQEGSLAYANEMLAEVEGTLNNAYESIRMKTEMMLEAIKGNLEIVIANRKELVPAQEETKETVPSYEGYQDDEQQQDAEQYDESFQYDENSFMDHIN